MLTNFHSLLTPIVNGVKPIESRVIVLPLTMLTIILLKVVNIRNKKIHTYIHVYIFLKSLYTYT